MDYRHYSTNGSIPMRYHGGYRHDEDVYDSLEWEMQHRRHNDQYASQHQYQTPTEPEDEDDIRKKTFCGVLSRFAGKTSMQGIPYINAAKLWYAKLFWSLLTVVALAISIIHVYYLVSLYYEYNKKTQISLNFSSLIMPAITICHTNPVRESQLIKTTPAFRTFVRRLEKDMLNIEIEDTNITTRRRQKRFVSTLQNVNRTDFFNKDKFRPASDVKKDDNLGEQAVQRSIRDQFKYLYTAMPPKKRMEIGHDMRDMLIQCTFKGRVCKARNFKTSMSNTYGNCHTVESSDYIVEESGPENGLSLKLFMETQENVDAINFGSGLRLTIHHPNTTSFPVQEGFFVSPNTEINIGLRMTEIHRMTEPYGKCVDPTIYKEQYGLTYTRQTCQRFCQQRGTIDTCGCFNRLEDDIVAKMDVTGPNTTTKHCQTDKELKCMYRIEAQYRSEKLECSCDNPCSEQVYVRSLSSREWPTFNYAKLLIESVCDKDKGKSASCKHLEEFVNDTVLLPKNFVKINIYFEDLNYEKIEEAQDYDDVQFYSDVGGAIGLWIGLSMLSLCELLQLFVEFGQFSLYACCKIDCTSHHKVTKPKSKYAETTDNKTTTYKNHTRNMNGQSRF